MSQFLRIGRRLMETVPFVPLVCRALGFFTYRYCPVQGISKSDGTPERQLEMCRRDAVKEDFVPDGVMAQGFNGYPNNAGHYAKARSALNEDYRSVCARQGTDAASDGGYLLGRSGLGDIRHYGLFVGAIGTVGTEPKTVTAASPAGV